MANYYYLWAYPDGGSGWIGSGWVDADYQHTRVPYGYSEVTPYVHAFPPNDSGWWYAQPDPRIRQSVDRYGGGSTPDQWGRYEAKVPGELRVVLRGDVAS